MRPTALRCRRFSCRGRSHRRWYCFFTETPEPRPTGLKTPRNSLIWEQTLLSDRGYGRSEGSPDEQGVYADGRSALQEVQTQQGFSLAHTYSRSVPWVGRGHRRCPEPAGCRLDTGFAVFLKMGLSRSLSALAWIMGEPVASIEQIPRVIAPILFIHGERDEIVPMNLGQRLYAQCRSPKTWKTIL